MALSNNTNDLQQSRFLPLLQQAEISIKKMITKYMLNGGSEFQLRQIIDAYIKDFATNKLPMDILNRQSYINGLFDMSKKVIGVLRKQRLEFVSVLGLLSSHLVKTDTKHQKSQVQNN